MHAKTSSNVLLILRNMNIPSLGLIGLRESIRDGKSLGQRSLEELQKIRKEAQDSTRISCASLIISFVAIIVAFIK